MDQNSDPTMNQNQDSDTTIWYNVDFYDIDKEDKPKMTPPCYLTDKVPPRAPKKSNTAPDRAPDAAQDAAPDAAEKSAARKLYF